MKAIFRSGKLWISVSVAALLYFGVRYFYFQPEFTQGEAPPSFTGTLPDGSQFQSDQLRGSYVLVDFWASWCGPCIRDFPEIDSLHQKYHKARPERRGGLEVVQIGVEESEQRWRAALRQFSPISPYQLLDNVTSLRFFDGPLTKAFGVKRLPSSFLLDPEGRIIGTNLDWEDVDRILSSELR